MEKSYLLSFFVLFLPFWVKASNRFTLPEKGETCQTVPVNVDISNDYSFSPFLLDKTNKTIAGLSIDGSFTRLNKHYLIRILLKDVEGKEYLIMESYREINDDYSGDFVNYCEETSYLDNIQPDSIRIIVRGARLQLTNIHFINSKSKESRSSFSLQSAKKESRKAQVEEIVKRINRYNISHNKLWRAGVTGISLKNYEDKKRILNLGDEQLTGGIEYYVDGIFEIGELEDAITTRTASASSFVESFDWRWQHGRNWITPNKNQGNSGYCSAFTAVAVTEAMTRLYYNRLVDIDLSEQEAACCNGSFNPWKGMTLSAPLEYIKNHGVCDEQAYPFVNSPSAANCRSSEISPNELVSIRNYFEVERSENAMKEALIKNGPLSSSVKYWGYTNVPDSLYYRHHAMAIVGFGQLHVGDTIYHWIEDNGYGNGDFTVQEGDPHIGMTYWIYKNSYGEDLDSARHGYRYIIHYNYNESIGSSYYIQPLITSMKLTDNDIVCEDSDGDGYYFWGLGQKPSWVPNWVPDIRDGDDSSSSLGQMYLSAPYTIGEKEYLFPNSIPPLLIQGDTTFDIRKSLYSHIVIAPNATLNIQNTLNLFGRVTITIESGGELNIDGGVITNANIDLAVGGKLTIKNGGKLVMRTNTDFLTPKGALVEIESGSICRSNDY